MYKIIKDSENNPKVEVIFDIDTTDVEGDSLGTIIDFEDLFLPYLDKMLDTSNSEVIGPLVTTDSFGWLITTYVPILNSQGEKVAYGAADIDMYFLANDMTIYVTKVSSLLGMITLLAIALSYYFTDYLILSPIDKLVYESKKLSKEEIEDWASNKPDEMNRIESGDEMEALYSSLITAEGKITSDFKQIEQQTAMMLRMEKNIVFALAKMVESQDENTGDHIERTSFYVYLIAQQLLKENKESITPEYADQMGMAAPLHDVGKIKIPDAILNKPGKLTKEEYDLMKTHTTEGARVIDMALDGISENTYLVVAKKMAAYHHEWYDGTGYCAHLKGKKIPLSARVMAVADVFDALVSKRSYKEAFSYEESIAIIKKESGTLFDPVVVQAFLNDDVQKEVKDFLKRKV